MAGMSADGAERLWAAAVEQASQGAERVVTFASRETSWDFQAVRGALSIGYYALACRGGIEAMSAERLAWHLREPSGIRAWMEAELVAAGHNLNLTEAASGDAVAEQWAWLDRHWEGAHDPRPPGQPLWDGLRRGIACALSGSVFDICQVFIVSACEKQVAVDRGAWLDRQRVRITDGQDAARCGYVSGRIWHFDEAAKMIAPGLPTGYEVVLDWFTPGILAEPASGPSSLEVPAEWLSTDADGLIWPVQKAPIPS